MRVSSLNNMNAMMAQLNTNSLKMTSLMQQLSTQKRVNAASDDPIAATRIAQLQREQAAMAQYQDNITSLGRSLAIQETLVKSTTDLLYSLQDNLRLAANETHTAEDMAGFGSALSSLTDSLVDILNTKNESGNYLFGGTQNHTAPVVWDSEREEYVWMGNNGSREGLVANNVTVSDSIPLVQCFSGNGETDSLAILNQLTALSEKMQDPTQSPASYRDDISAMIATLDEVQNSVGALFTELGGRQNHLTLLEDAHSQIGLANQQTLHELEDADIATTTINLQLYVNATQVTFRAWNMVNQLSLFSTL